MTGRARLAAGAVAFVVLATANAGGYRFGIGDQAYYTAAQALSADPALFPRDAALLAAQSRYMVIDDVIGGLVRTTGLTLQTLSFALYLVTLVALFAAAVAFARALGASWWGTSALVLLLTLRHRIPKTGANTLEGYMHPRLLAFALGVAALAWVLRRREGLALALIAGAAVLHTTTALWFALAVAVAAFVNEPAWRRGATAVFGGAAIAAAWATSVGPFSGRIEVMDPAWVDVLRTKDYLFAADWPAYAWIANLGALAAVVLLFAHRHRRGVTAPGEGGLVAALVALVVLFLLSVPLTSARLALPVQLQVNRVFWIVDFVLAASLAWWLLDDWAARIGGRARAAVLVVLVLLSAGRGFFVTAIAAGRPLVQLDLPDTPWTDAMRWLRAQPKDWHVLADPGHAWKYGASVRVSAWRDTLLESEKDTALAMYDRDVAERVAERQAALEDFDRLTTGQVRSLDAQYGLDALVVPVDRAFAFPVLYRNAQFVIYDLR